MVIQKNKIYLRKISNRIIHFLSCGKKHEQGTKDTLMVVEESIEEECMAESKYLEMFRRWLLYTATEKYKVKRT